MVVSLCVFDTVLLEASWDWLQDVELRQLLDTAAITKADEFFISLYCAIQ